MLSIRRKWIIGSIILCVLFAVFMTMTMKPTYQAVATIELNKGSGSLDLGLGDALSQQLTSGGDTLQTDLQTETSILTGDSLALAVIQRLKLASQPPFVSNEVKDPEQGLPLEDSPRTRSRLLGIFSSHLKVKPVHGTRLIQVTFESHDPKQAAQIANAIIEAYKSQYLQSHYDATTETSSWLTAQLSDLKTNVQDAEKKLTDYEKANGILSFNMTGSEGGKETGRGGGGAQIHSPVVRKLDALSDELTQAEANRIAKEAIYRLAKTGDADVVLDLGSNPLAQQAQSSVLTQGGGLSNLQMLHQQQSGLKVQLAQASNSYGANNRHLKDIETQIHSLDDQIQTELQLVTKRAKADLDLAKQTEDELRRQFQQQQEAASKLNETAIEFAVLSEEALSRKALYEDLFTKLQEANVSAGIKATNITIVDPARTQFSPVRPKPVLYLAIGILVGVFLGLITAYIADSFDRTLSSPQQVEELTGKPVIGVIPDLRQSGRTYRAPYAKRKQKKVEEEPVGSASVWMLTHPESSAAEAFRELRTSIMLSRAGGGPKILLITSCIPGEGKTTVSANLATAFAQFNKKTIIVEADMRLPRMRHVLDVPNDVGLSSVLSGLAKYEDAIIRGAQLPMLDVLPAGPRPPNPSELLGSTAFDDLLEYLKSRYEIILIDSPPALLVTDPVSISSKVDAAIWVCQVGKVTTPQLTRAAHLIERNGMPVIGFVVNRMSSRLAGYGDGYGYEYEYYGSYYKEKNKDEA